MKTQTLSRRKAIKIISRWLRTGKHLRANFVTKTSQWVDGQSMALTLGNLEAGYRRVELMKRGHFKVLNQMDLVLLRDLATVADFGNELRNGGKFKELQDLDL